MRILVIANSHGAGLAMALKENPAPPTVQIDFLCADARTIPLSVSRDGQSIVIDPAMVEQVGHVLKLPDHAVENHTIDTALYDRIFIYGFQLLSARDGRNWGKIVAQASTGLSSALWSNLAVDCARASDHVEVLTAIITDENKGRIVSLPSPFPNIDCPHFEPAPVSIADRIAAFQTAVAGYFASHGVRFAAMPDTLLDAGGYATSPRYKNDRVKDSIHLNLAGSGVVMAHILDIAQNPPHP